VIAGGVDSGDKFIAGDNNTSEKLLLLTSTSGQKFNACDNDTSEQLSTVSLTLGD
jgi:hypothetical protein